MRTLCRFFHGSSDYRFTNETCGRAGMAGVMGMVGRQGWTGQALDARGSKKGGRDGGGSGGLGEGHGLEEALAFLNPLLFVPCSFLVLSLEQFFDVMPCSFASSLWIFLIRLQDKYNHPYLFPVIRILKAWEHMLVCALTCKSRLKYLASFLPFSFFIFSLYLFLIHYSNFSKIASVSTILELL